MWGMGSWTEDSCETGVANTHVSHHYLVTADVAARRPPWEYHLFQISQLVALGMAHAMWPKYTEGWQPGNINTDRGFSRFFSFHYLLLILSSGDTYLEVLIVIK
jgi:hypothetical protein